MKHVIYLVVVIAMFIGGCGKDKPTESPDPSPGAGTLLMSRLLVSVIPGMSDTVTVHAADADGSPRTCTISNSDPNVATATISDSTIAITGVAHGVTTVTIRNGVGDSCTLPVQVYNHRILDAGELLITYTDSFASPSDVPGVVWDPVPPQGFHALGTYFYVFQTGNPNRVAGAMVVQAKPGSDAVAFSDSSRSYYKYYGTGQGFWRPVPPDGYKAMGILHSQTTPQPIACIREDLTVPGEPGYGIMDSIGASTDNDFWTIEAPDAGYHEGAYLAPGTFLFVIGDSPDYPGTNPLLTNVLKVDLPMLAEAPSQEYTPNLSSYSTPPDVTAPTMSRAMLVPFTIVKDAGHVNDFGWRVANSPFYRLERQVYYKLLYFNHNQTSQIQTNSFTMTSGITTTESQRIWNETGVSLSAEAGVNFKAISGKIVATVSTKFGYESQTAVAQLQQKSVSTSINTSPGKAAALWQQFDKYVLYRHNGTKLEAVTSWEFGIDSYVTDEYPN